MESWFKEIERARTEAEVVASARDFCFLLHPRELDGLPGECRCFPIDRLRDLLDYLARARERLGELGQKH